MDEDYEEKFVFPLIGLIKERAKEKGISHSAVCAEVIPESAKTIRCRHGMRGCGVRQTAEGAGWIDRV